MGTITSSATHFLQNLPTVLKVPRHQRAKDVIEQLNSKHRFLALLGNNGSGKTTFINSDLKEGLNPMSNSESGEESKKWKIVSVNPGINPIGNLASALATPAGILAPNDLSPYSKTKIVNTLNEGTEGLVNVYKDAIENYSDSPPKLLIVIDQLEEFFGYQQLIFNSESGHLDYLKNEYFRERDDVLFFNLIISAVKSEEPIYFIFVINSENLSFLNSYRGLPELVSVNRYFFPEIKEWEVRNELEKYLTDDQGSNITPIIDSYSKKLLDKIVLDYSTLLESGSTAALFNLNLTLHILKKEWEGLTGTANGNPSNQQANKSSISYSEQIYKFYKQPNSKIELPLLNICVQYHGEQVEYEISKEFVNFNTPNLPADVFKRFLRSLCQKDTHPSRMALPYPQKKENLLKLCFRTGPTIEKVEKKASSFNFDPYGMLKSGVKRVWKSFHDGQTVNPDSTKSAVLLNPQEQEALNSRLLKSIIEKFNNIFEGGILIKVQNAGNLVAKYAVDSDKSVISISSYLLDPTWRFLEKEIDLEYDEGSSYKRIAAKAEEYYLDLKNEKDIESRSGNHEPEVEDDEITKENDPLVSYTPPMLLINLPDKDEEKEEVEDIVSYPVKDKPGKYDLLPGRALGYKSWLDESLPNETWVKRYASEFDVSAKLQASDRGTLKERQKEEQVFLVESFGTRFTMVKHYINFFNEKYKNQKEQEIIQANLEAKKAKRIANLFRVISVLILGLTVLSGWFYIKADRAKTNVELLNFVDVLTKSNVIDKAIYQSEEFANIRSDIEEDNNIHSNELVIDSLAAKGILGFPESGMGSARYNEYSYLAMEDLFELHEIYHDPKKLVNVSQRLINTATKAVELNSSLGPRSYQFPYIYQALEENVKILTAELNRHLKRSGKPLVEELTWPPGSVVTCMVSNPNNINNDTTQLAIADAKGNVGIFEIFDQGTIDGGFTHQVVEYELLTPINESIVSINYSADGQRLYVGTIRGHIYGYSGFGLPIGRINPNPRRMLLNIDGENYFKDPIISIFPTQSNKFAIVVTASEIVLLGIDASKSLVTQVKSISLGEKLNTIRTAAINDTHDVLFIGGNTSSAIVQIDIENLRETRIINYVNHPETAITAANIEHCESINYTGNIVFLGTEKGDILINSLDELKAMADQTIDEKDFTHINGIHSSTISNLFVNKSEPYQLISSGFDGNIWIVNLDLTPYRTQVRPLIEYNELDDKPWYDHIRLEENGQGIWRLILIDQNEILITENINVRKWKTNLSALIDELRTLRHQFINELNIDIEQ